MPTRYVLKELVSQKSKSKIEFFISLFRNLAYGYRRFEVKQFPRWFTPVGLCCQLRSCCSNSWLLGGQIFPQVSQFNYFFLANSSSHICVYRAIMGCGLLVWSIVTMAGSFMTTFETLLIFRCLGGNAKVLINLRSASLILFSLPQKELEKQVILLLGQPSSVIFTSVIPALKCWPSFILPL